MNHFKHPLCNGVLTAHENDRDTVDDLHVQRGALEGIACTRSFWKPDANELRCLEAGAPVVLTILGLTHAPLRIDVPNPDEGFPALPDFQHDEALLKQLCEEGYNKFGQITGEGVRDIAKTYAMQILRKYGR